MAPNKPTSVVNSDAEDLHLARHLEYVFVPYLPDKPGYYWYDDGSDDYEIINVVEVAGRLYYPAGVREGQGRVFAGPIRQPVKGS